MNLTDALVGIIGFLLAICGYLLKLAIVNPIGSIEKKTAILEIRVVRVESRLDALENK